MSKALMRSNHNLTEGLDTYMADVRHIPVLSREDEQALALRLVDENDLDAAHRLVTSNLRFVVKVALEYKAYNMRILDLVQEGNIGLMHAVRKFDPHRGYRLITYAVWWIRAYIQTYVIRAWSLVKMGTTQAQRKLFFKLASTRSELDNNEDHRLLSVGERHEVIAERLGVRPKDVTQMERRMAARDFSLDMTLDEGETTHLDMLPETGEGTEAVVAHAELKGALSADLKKGLAKLNAREREVITLRYLGDEPPTLKEVGAKWGVSRERARQIEAAARTKLKKFLLAESEVLRDYLPEVAGPEVLTAAHA